MANKYTYGNDIESLMEEEDRECDNDLKRAKTRYYDTLTQINQKYLKILNSMDDNDIKKSLLRIPVKSIDK